MFLNLQQEKTSQQDTDTQRQTQRNIDTATDRPAVERPCTAADHQSCRRLSSALHPLQTTTTLSRRKCLVAGPTQSHPHTHRHTDIHTPLPSDRQHRSNGKCLEGKGENYQLCSVQYCVQQLCTVQCTHTYEQTNSSLDWVLSHWAHFTVLRFIYVYVFFCVLTVYCMHA